MSLKIRVSTTGVTATSRRLSLYGRKLKTYRSLYRGIGAEIARAERAWFATRGAGTWQPLSPRYAAWKARHFPGRPLMVRSGKLRAALTSQAQFIQIREPDVMIIDLPESVWYGRVHQGDGNEKVNLPRRPPLIPLAEMRRIARKRTEEHVRFRG